MGRQVQANGETTDQLVSNQVTATVIKGDIEKSIRSNGNLVPQTEANLAFSINGEVAEILVEEGDFVEAGETLMLLETTALERQVEDAELQVKMRQAELDLLETDELVDVRQRVSDAELALDEAEEELEIADAEAELDAANEALDAILTDQFALNLTLSESQLAMAENTLEAANANLESATLTAPFSGVISQINVAEGGMASGVVLSMFDADSFVVELEIDEIDLLELKEGS